MPDEPSVEVTVETNSEPDEEVTEVEIESPTSDTEKIDETAFTLGNMAARLAAVEEKADNAVTLASIANEKADALDVRTQVEETESVADKLEEVSEKLEEVSEDGIITPGEWEEVAEVTDVDVSVESDDEPTREHWLTRKRGR